MSRYAIVKDGAVVNICLWDGDTKKWTPPEGAIAVPAERDVGIGWKYERGKLKYGEPPAQPQTETEVDKILRDPIQLAKLREALK